MNRRPWLYLMGWMLAALFASGLVSAAEPDGDWPRTLSLGDGQVTIYPLQAESLEGETLHYRAALAWRATPDAEPVFGAGWFVSDVTIDRQGRLVRPRDLRLVRTRFPKDNGDIEPQLAAAVQAQSPAWNLVQSLDELESTLQAASAEQKSLQQLNTAPPEVVYRDRPAVLVTLDGEPVLREIENSPYQAVINTPYPLIFDGRNYWLNTLGDVWYRSDRATGPYRFDNRPPADIAAMVKPDEAATDVAPAAPITAENAPEIIVATRPTELIVTDGPAAFVPLTDELLVLQNSDDDVFMHLGSQQYFIVLAGRWYRAARLDGPWTYEPAEQLPAAFADIPENSAQADSRVYVAGTPEAEAAVLDAQVPQTAAVARGPADVEVSYDGQPDFRPVDGTDLQYAANTGAAVLQADRQYYLVEDGVWYVSDNPNGPWEVSAWRPQSVSRIAPTSPVYHVKYVYIYDYTPDVVYVGYTPGYYGSYVYYGTVVYGTGWHYQPWVSPAYYYPRPSTWGFHVGYNPWTGWGFGLSWNWGWGWGWSPWYASYWTGGYWHQPYHWHHRHYGYWGPRGYRPRPTPYGGHGDRDHYAGGGRGSHGGPPRDGYRPREGERHDNLYRDRGQQARVVQTRDTRPYRRETVSPADLRLKADVRNRDRAADRNLVVADSNGKVRKSDLRAPRLQEQKSARPGAPPAGVQTRDDVRPSQGRQSAESSAMRTRPAFRQASPGQARTSPPAPAAAAPNPAPRTISQVTDRVRTRAVRAPASTQPETPVSRRDAGSNAPVSRPAPARATPAPPQLAPPSAASGRGQAASPPRTRMAEPQVRPERGAMRQDGGMERGARGERERGRRH